MKVTLECNSLDDESGFLAYYIEHVALTEKVLFTIRKHRRRNLSPLPPSLTFALHPAYVYSIVKSLIKRSIHLSLCGERKEKRKTSAVAFYCLYLMRFKRDRSISLSWSWWTDEESSHINFGRQAVLIVVIILARRKAAAEKSEHRWLRWSTRARHVLSQDCDAAFRRFVVDSNDPLGIAWVRTIMFKARGSR